MDKNPDFRIISTTLFWTYFLIGLSSEGLVLWLFPNTGLGGLLCWPIAFFFSSVLAFGLLKIYKKFRSSRVTVISFGAFLFIQVFLQLLLTGQEYGKQPIEQISEAVSTYRRFDEIDFSNFSELSQFERVSYIFKNKDSLPDSYLILSIDSVNDQHLLPGDPHYFSTSKKYLIEIRNGHKTWNTKELEITENDSSTLIIERLPEGDSVIYRTRKNFLRGGQGDFQNAGVSLFTFEDDLELNTGLQLVFYSVLEFTKKASR